MSGFRNEKEVWAAQKPNFVGKWDRYELMTPAGHPDVKGSHNFDIHYIENKVGDKHTYDALEESQKEYIQWLLDCQQHVWLCFGGTREKSLFFYYLRPSIIDTSGERDFLKRPLIRPAVPWFWRGKQWLMPGNQGDGAIRYCGAQIKNTASIDTRARSKRPLK